MIPEPLISELAGDPAMGELLRDFATGLQEKVAQIDQALETGDIATLKRIGHQLKGSGGGYGYQALTDAGDRLERAALAGSLDEALRTAAGDVLELIARVRAGLRD